MADYIEGKRPVLEALKSEVPFKRIYLAQGVKRDKVIGEIVKRANKLGYSVKEVSRGKLDELSEGRLHQGIIAEAGGYPYVSAQDVIDEALKRADENNGNALVIVLDHLTDAGNLGAIARSAEVVGAAGILIPNKRSAHVTPATYKSSAGAVAHLKIAQIPNIAQMLDRLKQAGFWVAGASEKAKQDIWSSPLSGKIVLVMGSEGEGLARLTQENCDFLVSLPQVGKVGSLNVAQAASVCMYEWMRQSGLPIKEQ